MTQQSGDDPGETARQVLGDQVGAAADASRPVERPADRATGATDFDAHAALPFPVVAIGGSAGGLRAFTEFFDALPENPGIAFVLIQHLPPDSENLLTGIISRHTSLPVRQATHGVPVEPNNVYVIRPGHTLTIEGGQLRLGESVQQRGHRRPVDDFFRSLAAEQKEKAVIIVMSGMGSNGSAGAQAVKAAGGICIAQDPATAEFQSMPRSLIDSGYADQVLAPRDIPPALMGYVRHPYLTGVEHASGSIDTVLQRERPSFNEILAILRTQTGRDFRGYKRPTLLRRMQRRMGLAQITHLSEYAALLRRNDAEVTALADDLTINVTGFFRDLEAWDALRLQVIRPLLIARENRSPIRAWAAGCSSGEEAYTLAMLLAEEAEALHKQFDIKIFATDTAEKPLALARAGIYSAGVEGDLDPERIDRFFEKDEHTLRIRKAIREMVVFAPQNLLTDPPFSRLDLVTCRNLLIYLEPETQRRVISLLHFSLREGGVLFLGTSETAGAAEESFTTVNRKWRIYRRIGAARQGSIAPAQETAFSFGRDNAERSATLPRSTLGLLVQRTLTERYSPPAVVVDRRGRVVYFQGDTDRFIAQQSGEPTQVLTDLVRDGLRTSTRAALRQAMNENRTVSASEYQERGGQRRRVQITVSPMRDPQTAQPEIFMVTFQEEREADDTSAAELSPDTRAGGGNDPRSDGRDHELERELRTVRDELQSTIEELESSNEELKASNEEVTSVNEELQSTNEELETSKEELQSLNEELTTVNAQLQVKIEEAESTSSDLSNLLSSTNIAVVFLDTSLRVRRFTPAVRDLLELIPSDVGRPIEHMAQKFVGGNLVQDAQNVLDSLVPVEAEIRSTSGRFYIRRILPYRTTDNRIAGVVVTFFDISERKRAEDHVQAAQARLQAIVEQMPTAILIADAGSGRIVMGNREAAAFLGRSTSSQMEENDWNVSRSLLKGLYADGRPYAAQDWPLFRSLAQGDSVHDEEIVYVRSDGTRGIVSASSAAVRDSNGRIVAAVGTFADITARKRGEAELRVREERYRALLDGAQDYALILIAAQGEIEAWSAGAQRIFGFSSEQVLGHQWTMLFGAASGAASRATELMHAARENGSTVDLVELTRADGEAVKAEISIARLRPSGALRGFLLIVREP
jgi:two-component system, chemotaxis family, CheB/CheR fusion protein